MFKMCKIKSVFKIQGILQNIQEFSEIIVKIEMQYCISKTLDLSPAQMFSSHNCLAEDQSKSMPRS